MKLTSRFPTRLRNSLPMNLFLATKHRELYKAHSVAYEGDAGIDLFFPRDVLVPGRGSALIDLEVSCEMKTPSGSNVSYYLYPRSSISKTPVRMSNAVGIIDSMYRHNIKVAVDNISEDNYLIKKGTKLFQICSPCLSRLKLNIVDELSASDRGEGFGSSN